MADEKLDFELRLIDSFTRTAKGMAKALEGIDKRILQLGKNNGLKNVGRDARRASKDLSGLAARGDKLISLSANLNLASNSMFMLGRQAAGILLAPIKEAATFEKSMSRVKAVTSDFTESQRELARVLGRDTKFTADQAAQGMASLAIAGFSAQEQMDSLASVLSLDTAAGMSNLGDTAKIASRTIRAFGLDASEMGRVADVLTATFTNSNTELAGLGETFKFVAPVAKSLGVSLEETAKLAGILGDAGIDASMAGTSMRLVMLRLAGTTPQATKALKAMNITTKDAHGNLRGVSDILIDVGNKMSRLGGADKIKRTTQLFGRLGVTAGTVLIDQLTNSGVSVEKMTKALADMNGVADRTATTMEDNLAGDLTKVESAFSSLLITVGDQFTPMLRDLSTVLINDIIKPLEMFVRENQTLVKVMGGSLAVIAAVAAALGSLAVIASSSTLLFGGILKGWALVAAAFAPVTAAFKTTVIFFRAIASITTVVVKSIATAVAAVITLPAAFLIGLGAIIVGMFVWWDTVKKFAEDIGDWFFFGRSLSESFIDGWNSLIKGWGPVAQINGILGSIKSTFGIFDSGSVGNGNARAVNSKGGTTTNVGGNKTMVFQPNVTVTAGGGGISEMQTGQSTGDAITSSLLKLFDDGVAQLGAG